MTSQEFTKRLLTYRLSLLHLRQIGLSDVYSYLIAGETGFSAALIRKDFSRLKVKGKRRGGYAIETILQAIDDYFGEKKINKVVLIGMGNIGKAIAQYKDFQKHKIRIIASFDIDPAKQRKKFIIPVFPMNKFSEITHGQEIAAAIIAVPSLSAQSVCDQILQSGITGILNFAPVNLKVPDNVFVSNVSLSDELRQVIYHAKQQR